MYVTGSWFQRLITDFKKLLLWTCITLDSLNQNGIASSCIKPTQPKRLTPCHFTQLKTANLKVVLGISNLLHLIHTNSSPWTNQPWSKLTVHLLHIQQLHTLTMFKQTLNFAVRTTFVSISVWLLLVWILTSLITPFNTSFLIKCSLIYVCFVFLWWTEFFLK